MENRPGSQTKVIHTSRRLNSTQAVSASIWQTTSFDAESAAALSSMRKAGTRWVHRAFHGYDEEQSEIEIGWTFLARSLWDGVHNSELKTADARARVQVRKTGGVPFGPENWRSQKGDGENRRSARGHAAQRSRPGLRCVPNYYGELACAVCSSTPVAEWMIRSRDNCETT